MVIKRNSIVSVLAAVIIAVFFATPSVYAAGQKNSEAALEELKEFKHNYLKKELKLSRDQEAAFFKYYDQMFEELLALGDQTRRLERKVLRDSNATDLEMESAARAVFELKKKEGEIELKYFDQFKTILSKRQLLMLKPVERKMIIKLLEFKKQQEQNTRN